MLETVFEYIFLVGTGFALIFGGLLVQDLWRQSRQGRTKVKPVRLGRTFKSSWRPVVRGYDYPELLLEDLEAREQQSGEGSETKTDGSPDSR